MIKAILYTFCGWQNSLGQWMHTITTIKQHILPLIENYNTYIIHVRSNASVPQSALALTGYWDQPAIHAHMFWWFFKGSSGLEQVVNQLKIAI